MASPIVAVVLAVVLRAGSCCNVWTEFCYFPFCPCLRLGVRSRTNCGGSNEKFLSGPVALYRTIAAHLMDAVSHDDEIIFDKS